MMMTASPHIHCGATTRKIMGNVLIALLPALILSVVFHGWRVLMLAAVCIGASLAGEWCISMLPGRHDSPGNGSAAVTGMLLAMTLPVTTPVWMGIIGALFAVVVVKGFCGGLGENIFNPALGARAFLMLCFPASLFVADATAGATPLHTMQIPAIPEISLWNQLLGNAPGCLGETPRLALIAGGIYLMCRKVISARIPLAYLGTVAALTLIFAETEQPWLWMCHQMLSGGLILGAFFMATDYVTSPATPWGKILYGMGCGGLTVLFRSVGLYPESVTFAILWMNAISRLLERATAPRVFGMKGAKQ